MFKFAVLLFIIHSKKNFFKYMPFKYFPVNTRKIVFSNYAGMGYGCNPKYIAQLLLKTHPELKLIWLINPKNGDFKFPKGIKKVNIKSVRAFYDLCTAKIWVDNYHKVELIKKHLTKRPEQYYIQTWHGSLGIKKIEADVNAFITTKSWKEYAIENAKMQDYLLSNSEFEDGVYKSAFWGEGKILRIGHARNDIFFKENNRLKQNICKLYNIDENKNILIYVPTFRQGCSTKIYDLDYENLKNALEKKFGGDWVIFVRMHRNIKSKPDLQGKDYVYDASSYDDVQELLACADAAVTDYSSCIFDFVLTRKPGFIYAPDIERYNHERGFYYSLYETPFPVAQNNTELALNIENFEDNIYKSKVEDFLRGKGCVDDGNSSARAVELIEKLITDKSRE